MNGKPAGQDVDLYSAKVDVGEPVKIPGCTPVENRIVIRVEVVGRNPASKGFLMGLDCVVLKPLR